MRSPEGRNAKTIVQATVGQDLQTLHDKDLNPGHTARKNIGLDAQPDGGLLARLVNMNCCSTCKAPKSNMYKEFPYTTQKNIGLDAQPDGGLLARFNMKCCSTCKAPRGSSKQPARTGIRKAPNIA